MFCPQCGAQVPDGSGFCPACGFAMSGQTRQGDPMGGAPQGFSGYPPQGGQPPYGVPSPVQPGVPYQAGHVQTDRSLAAYILLSIVTCGIYGIYWLVCMVNDLNTAANTTNDTTGGVVFLLSIITCGIYLWVWMYKAGEKVAMIKRRSGGYAESNNGLLYLLLAIFGLSIVSYCLIQSELNNVAAY